MKDTEKDKKRKRRGQVITRSPDTHLIRVPLHRDPATGRRVYHNETFHGSKTQAEKRCTQLLARIDDGSYFRPSEMSVGELLDRWLSHRDVRPVTRVLYEKLARLYITPSIGALPLARLTPILLQDKFDELKGRGLAPLTIRNVRGALSSALKYAVRLRLLRENPVADIVTPKAKRRPVRAMTEEQATRLVETARTDPHGLMFVFWLFTGLRPAEFIGLRWADVELAGEGEHAYGVLNVRQTVVRVKDLGWDFYEPKTEAGKRPVYFPAWLYYDLMEHKARQEEHKRKLGDYRDHGLVFAASNGEPMMRQTVSMRMLKPLLVRAGLPSEFSPYTMRRSFSSLLRRAGVSAKEVSEQMGHTNVNFTDDVYVTVYDSAKREMSDKLERVLSAGLGTQQAHNETDAVM
jgi:integrase